MSEAIDLAWAALQSAIVRYDEAFNQLEALEESLEDELEALVIDDNDEFHVKQLGRLWVLRLDARFRCIRRAENCAKAEMHYKVVLAAMITAE